jgi:RNA-binding protein YlmH
VEEKEFLKRRLCELAERASGDGYKTHSYFLSADEQALLLELAGEKKANLQASKVGEATYFAYGGGSEVERKVLFFLPEFLSKEDELANEENGETLACLHIEGKKAAYAEELDHRDYLGALMSLGYEREQFGDILVAGKEAYVFCFKAIAAEVAKNLLSVRHTYVKTTILLPKDCPIQPHYEEKRINVASLRLDGIIAEIYGLSREDGKALVEAGDVILDGLEKSNAAYLLKGGERISVKGHGKFLFVGEETLSRKGRLFVLVKIYR